VDKRQPVVEVEIPPAQRDQLAPPQARHRRRDDERSVLRADGVRQRIDLSNARHRTLGCSPRVSTLDATWIPRDPPVVYSRVQNGAEQSVGLRNGLLGAPRAKQLGAPRTHGLGRDPGQRGATENRPDVQAVKALV
jgi:hypothetical protein